MKDEGYVMTFFTSTNIPKSGKKQSLSARRLTPFGLDA